MTLGAYLGGVASNQGELNPVQWDYTEGATYCGIGIGFGAAIGYGILNPGTFTYVFGVESPWVAGGIGLSGSTLAMGQGTEWNYDLRWSTSGGGGKVDLGSFTTNFNKKDDEPELDEDGNGAFSIGASFMYASPNTGDSYPTGVGLGYFRGTTTYGLYFSTIKGRGTDLQVGLGLTYYDSYNHENMEILRISGDSPYAGGGVFWAGYTISSDANSSKSATRTYLAHTYTVSNGFNVGYSQGTTRTYVLPLLPMTGLLIFD